jgi:hypothetical protein
LRTVVAPSDDWTDITRDIPYYYLGTGSDALSCVDARVEGTDMIVRFCSNEPGQFLSGYLVYEKKEFATPSGAPAVLLNACVDSANCGPDCIAFKIPLANIANGSVVADIENNFAHLTFKRQY